MNFYKYFILIIFCLGFSGRIFAQDEADYDTGSADSSFDDAGGGDEGGFDDGGFDDGGGSSSDDSQSTSSSGGGSSTSSLKDEYSFSNIFHKHKKIFSVAVNYDLRFINPKKNDPIKANGWGLALEYFPINWLSLYFSLSDNTSKETLVYYKEHSDTIYFGSRFYFSFLYLGIGATNIANDIFYTEDGKQKSSPYWNMYFQFGANFAIMKHVSIDTGVNLFSADKALKSTGNFYLGIKYTY